MLLAGCQSGPGPEALWQQYRLYAQLAARTGADDADDYMADSQRIDRWYGALMCSLREQRDTRELLQSHYQLIDRMRSAPERGMPGVRLQALERQIAAEVQSLGSTVDSICTDALTENERQLAQSST